MDALDMIVREVERDLERWANEPLLHEITVVKPEEQPTGESNLRAHKSNESDDMKSGVALQRCGGGRRVIRKSRGAS